MPVSKFDTFVSLLMDMDREELTRLLNALECDFPLDFTDADLASMSVERLRHVVTAVGMRAHNLGKAAAVARI